MQKKKNLGGRPAMDGVQPGWMLLRATIVIEAFTRARQSGEKYEASLEIAVDAVKTASLGMKVSTSAVKKILKEFMPEHGEKFLKVTVQEPAVAITDTPNPPQKVYGAGFAPRPEYPLPSHRKSKKPVE